MPETGRVHHDALDGLRGLAFLMVFAAHLFNRYRLFWPVGRQGVWLFFVLSAFLLSEYFFKNPDKANSLYEWANYFFRRGLRIIPLFVVADLLYIQIGYISFNNIFWLHMWTIPVEFAFYLVLPFIVLFFIYILKQNRIIMLIALFLSVILSQILFPETSAPTNSPIMIYYLPVFLYGVGVGVIYNKICSAKNYLFDLAGFILLLVALLTLPQVWSSLFYPVSPDYYMSNLVLFGILWAGVLLCALNGKILPKCFESKYLGWVGKISYNAYLFHILVIYLVMKYISSAEVVYIPVSFLLVLVSSSIIYWFIERPLLKIRLKDLLVILG